MNTYSTTAFLFILLSLGLSFQSVITEKHESLSVGVQEAWVRHYISGLVPGADYATAVAVDKPGNIYVTGYSPNVPFGYDYVTIKYNVTGKKIWVAKYNGPGNRDDKPTALVVDANENVYVTGSCYVSRTDEDYVTVQYDAAGVQQWAARYNGPDNLVDQANALAVDANGNVYVTGLSNIKVTSTGITRTDYVTIKYGSNGKEQWVMRYNGPDNSYDQAVAIVVDASNNVYVTGASRYGGFESNISEYATIKYSPAGMQQWVARYHDPTIIGDSNPVGLAVDAFGNVYVAGTIGSSNFGDYATVKYNSTGVEQWATLYHGAIRNKVAALAVDQMGNVYVTGSSEGDSDGYATVKCNSSGMQQWVARHIGPIGSSERATDLAVDVAGNVYVTGVAGQSACTTIKYNFDGVEQWVAHSSEQNAGSLAPDPDLALDDAGNVYIAGTTSMGVGLENPDYITIKYNSSGAEQWVTRYNESHSSLDNSTALAVDALGNTYITGYSQDSTDSFDYATIKYNSTGGKQWLSRYDDGAATAIAVDDVGNVYVTGYNSGALTSHDYVTLKYDSRGTRLWMTRYNAPTNDLDNATALAVDAKGNVYVTGKSAGRSPTSTYDYATIKYNSSGVEQWVARYEPQPNSPYEPTKLALDAAGNVYVMGRTAIIKYNTAGKERWVDLPTAIITALAVDAAGNAYIAGAYQGDYAVIKYDSLGNKQWEAHYDAGSGEDVATVLVVDQFGNIYVTGQTRSLSFMDYATIKYNSSAVVQWVSRYNGPTNENDIVAALALDNFGNVYVTGTSSDGVNNLSDYATIKYNSAGVEQWVARYSEPAGSTNEPVALGLDAAGNVYVSGWSNGTNGGGWATYTTIKYVQTPVAVEEDEENKVTPYALAQNYPNPFNPSTTIEFSLPRASQVTLKIFNLAGEEIATLVSEKLSAGTHRIKWNANEIANGIYVCQLRVGGFVASMKLLLMK